MDIVYLVRELIDGEDKKAIEHSIKVLGSAKNGRPLIDTPTLVNYLVGAYKGLIDWSNSCTEYRSKLVVAIDNFETRLGELQTHAGKMEAFFWEEWRKAYSIKGHEGYSVDKNKKPESIAERLADLTLGGVPEDPTSFKNSILELVGYDEPRKKLNDALTAALSGKKLYRA